MKILHTSDWHLGRSLYSKKRYEEFDAFLKWLLDTMCKEVIDILLVCGDVFDTQTPSHRAQELYYQFLCNVAETGCRHVVIIAGNHDSPTFLNAPREILRSRNVHVVGCASDDLSQDVLLLEDASGEIGAIVCAVPYLRDRDIRRVEAGESLEDKDQKITEGIRSHYQQVCDVAEAQRRRLGSTIPIIAMGHLFTAGAQTTEGDGVRELYVGSLAHVNASLFPASIDYLALGHLHVPQKVEGAENKRYSGSPIPMGFGEASQSKSVCIVDFSKEPAVVDLVRVPRFQQLEQIRGSWNQLSDQIKILSDSQKSIWLEIIYEGDEIIGDLREKLESLTAKTPLEILRIKNNRILDQILQRTGTQETLEDLDVHQVFMRCLDAHQVSPLEQLELRASYQEIILQLDEADERAE